MAFVSFKKGLVGNLPSTYAEGTFYVTTDERAIYLDVSNSTRIRLGDFQEFPSVAALEANTNPSVTALYYVTDINCLAKWTGDKYVQINRDTGMTSVEVTGEGNAVTAAVYDETGRKLTLTKGATYMTADDVDSKINAKVGDLKIGDVSYDTVKAYVDKKTDGIATDAALESLTERVTTAEGKIDVLNGGKTTAGSVEKKIADAIEALALADTYEAKGAAAAVKGAEADDDTVATVYGARKLAQKGVDDAKTAKEAADAAKQAADAAQGDVDNLETLVGTIPTGATATTVVGYVDEKIAAIPAQTDYTVAITTPTAEGVAKRYNIKQAATGLDVNIDIPKDMVVSSGSVETKAEAGAWGEAGTYLHLVLANAESSDIYINVNDLIEYVKGGAAADGIITTTVTINEQGEHILTAAIGDGTITLTKLHADVQAAIGKAHEHANKTVIDGITADKVTAWDKAAEDDHTHGNKAVLDGITAEKITAWDGAETNAKAYTDTALTWGSF